MTALGLLAHWCLDGAFRSSERAAVARCRFTQVAALPPIERQALYRLLDYTDGYGRQKGRPTWH